MQLNLLGQIVNEYDSKKRKLGALMKKLKLFRLFNDGVVTPTKASRLLGIPISTAHLYLQQLIKQGLVQKFIPGKIKAMFYYLRCAAKVSGRIYLRLNFKTNKGRPYFKPIIRFIPNEIRINKCLR